MSLIYFAFVYFISLNLEYPGVYSDSPFGVFGNAGEEKHYNGLFSTKTCYKYVQNLDTSVETPPTCQAIHVNAVFRHGTRYPSAKDVIKFNKVVKVLKEASIAAQEGSPLKKLTFSQPFKVEQDKELASVGDNEMYSLGKRFYRRFPDLFKEPVIPSHYFFRSTCKRRSVQSSMAFSLGLFENHGTVGPMKYQPVPVTMSPCGDDPILRFFDICRKYEKEVVDNPLALAEVKKFMKTPVFQGVLTSVKTRLGVPELEALNGKMLIALFKLCAMSIAVFDETRETCKWCLLFEPNEYSVLEYALDLKNYYKRSSAYNITYLSSCPLLKDVMTRLNYVVNNETAQSSHRGSFYFSHGETLLPFLALMDIFKEDVRLTADNFEQMQDREFRASLLAPFSGNIAFVLFKCDKGYKIQVYINEKLVRLPCCNSKYDCAFEAVQKYYLDSVKNCNLGKMCNTAQVHSEL